MSSPGVSPGDKPLAGVPRRSIVQFIDSSPVETDPHTYVYSDDENQTSPDTPDIEDDPRLTSALNLVRTMSEPDLKAQCVRTEWGGLTSNSEREILLAAIQDATFWREVKDNTARDIEAAPEDDSDVDTKERLRQMFLCFDRSNTGKIDATQMQRMLLYMGVSATEKEVAGVVSTVDSDDDGFITSDEFVEIMERAQAGELAIEAPSKSNIKRASFRISAQSKRISV